MKVFTSLSLLSFFNLLLAMMRLIPCRDCCDSACGTLTPKSVVKLGTNAIAGILCEKSDRKAKAIVDLARKWLTLPNCPTQRNGPSTSADKHFVAAVTKSAKHGGVEGTGKWTLLIFMEDLGRTDILNADCYEVQQGVRWLTGAEKRCTAAAVREFVNRQNVRPHSLTRVTGILRELHRDVQAILSSGYKKRKTPNARDRVHVDAAIARARQDLDGL